MSARKLEWIEIKNIKAIKEFRCDVGSVTVIRGKNGSGKTSILDAVSSVFEGGHDAGLIRKGSSKGEVTLGISDGVVVRKAITPKGSTLTVKTSDGGLVKAPKRYVENLAAGFGYEPLGLIDANKKDRLKFLLEALPIEFTVDELRKALGEDRAPLEPIGLERLNQIRLGLYTERQDLNRKHRDNEGSVRSLEASLPDDDSADWGTVAADLQQQITESRETIASAESDMDAQKGRLKAEKLAEVSGKIETLRAEFDKQSEILRDELSTEEKRIDAEADKIYREGMAEIQGTLEKLTAEHATAKQKADESKRADGIRASIAKLNEDASGIEAERLGAKIERLDKVKTAKLSSLPIDGVDVRDGEIYIGGVEWDHVNTSERYVVAIQLATLQAGELGLMVCDKAEHLNPERFEEFKAALAQTGLTVIAARAEDGDLRVEAS